MFKLVLEKIRDQTANILWIIEKAREYLKKNIYFRFIDYAKASTMWMRTNCRKFLESWEYHNNTLSASWIICMQVKKQQLE